eukprot:2824848-Lingulodinium_polyedra.AAC.1
MKTQVVTEASAMWASLELIQRAELWVRHRRAAAIQVHNIANQICALETKVEELAEKARKEGEARIPPMIMREACLPT